MKLACLRLTGQNPWKCTEGVIGILGRWGNLLGVNPLGSMIMQSKSSFEVGSAEIEALGGGFRGVVGDIEIRSS